MADNTRELEEAIAQLRYLQNVYSQQYEIIENDIATYSISIASLQKNIELLDNAKTIEKSKILVSGEGGTYIEAKIDSIGKVLTYVGAGYLLEKDPESANAFLKEHQKKQEESAKKLVAEKQKIQKELLDISYKLGAMQQGQVF